jgi:hypothetical protein
VFVARPADDMRQAYGRILDELKNRGFTVVPEAEIPSDHRAVEYTEAALAPAEVSIHLLGEKRGYAPAEEDPIVRLQLACAGRRALSTADGDRSGAAEFRRLVWAPKILEDAEGAQPAGSAERDPLAVLDRFGEQIATDKVLSENLIRFIDFLAQYLDKTRPRVAPRRSEIVSGMKIFIDHAEDDSDYALELADALEERSFAVEIPVLEGKPSVRTAQNLKLMQECAAIALCWGSTTEAWVMAEASKLNEWRRIGRRDQVVTTLLAAPPSGKFKERRLRVKPLGVDRVIDMTDVDKPSSANLDAWLGPQGASAAGDD